MSFTLLWQDILISTGRVILWSLFSWFLGTLIGYCIKDRDGIYRYVIHPVNFIKQISPFAWLPLAILIFGISEWSIGFVLMISMLFPCIIMSVELFRSLSKGIIEEAQSSGAHGFELLTHIELPLAFKGLITHYRFIWGIGWNTVIAGEMLGVSKGLGFRLLDFRYLLAYREMLIYILVIGLIGVISDRLIKHLAMRYNYD